MNESIAEVFRRMERGKLPLRMMYAARKTDGSPDPDEARRRAEDHAVLAYLLGFDTEIVPHLLSGDVPREDAVDLVVKSPPRDSGIRQLRADYDAEYSRMEAESVRGRVPPIRVEP